MPKNNYITKQRKVQQGFFVAGLQSGRQQILDMLSLALRDPEIMGKDTFGKERLLKVISGIDKYLGYYEDAWGKTPETDYFRAKLDEALADAYGDKLHDTFMVRYEFLPEFDYETRRWK